MNEATKCKCPCHKMVSVFIVLIGLTFLLGAFGVLSAKTVSIVWPALLILAGLQTLCKDVCKCCS